MLSCLAHAPNQRKWDPTSPLPVDQQRRELVRSFINEDEIPPPSAPGPEWDSDAAQELVRSVLVPWRGQALRRIAQKYVDVGKRGYLPGQLILLRTHYGGDAEDDDKLRGWLAQADPKQESFGRPENHWWRILDDPALFDLGSEPWQSVYDRLPELASWATKRAFGESEVNATRDLVYAVEDREPEEDDFEDAVMSVASRGGFLLIADEQAFDEGELGLVFRDAKGNVVREGTIPPEEVEWMLGYDFRAALEESEYWLDAEIGKYYKTRGEIMRAILPVVMSETM